MKIVYQGRVEKEQTAPQGERRSYFNGSKSEGVDVA
jgi:hypothetical protein